MLGPEDATPDDHDGILALTRAAFGEADEPMVLARLHGPGAEAARWSVVRDRGRVVSTCCLLPFPLRVDGVDVPAGQVEFVASDPDYRRRGLVRRQFEHHHRRSAEAGHVVQLVLGIPYVYRRFGYGYGLDYPALYTVDPGATLPTDPSVTLRAVTGSDLAELDRDRLAVGRLPGGVVTDHRAALERQLWASELADPPGTGPQRAFVARRDGAVVGLSSMTVRDDEQRVYHDPSILADRAVSDTVLAHARQVAGDRELLVHDTAGADWSPHLAAVATRLPLDMGLYVRVGDPCALLRVLRPVLSARLAASPFADAADEVTISTFADAVRLAYAGGEVTGIERVPALEDPWVDRECGVAPDWFPALALGRWGARGLEARADDVSLGRHGDLLAALFPRRHADVAPGF